MADQGRQTVPETCPHENLRQHGLEEQTFGAGKFFEMHFHLFCAYPEHVASSTRGTHLLRHRDAAVEAAEVLRDQLARDGALRLVPAAPSRHPCAAVLRGLQHVPRHAVQRTLKVIRNVEDVLAEPLHAVRGSHTRWTEAATDRRMTKSPSAGTKQQK